MRGGGKPQYITSGSILGVGVTDGVTDGDSPDSEDIFRVALDTILGYLNFGLLMGALRERRWPLAFIS